LVNRTPLPYEPPRAALRACAEGLYPAEAAAELLISHASWLCRDDFRNGFVDAGTSITDGTTLMAAIDWPAAITALDEGGLPYAGQFAEDVTGPVGGQATGPGRQIGAHQDQSVAARSSSTDCPVSARPY
jgi:hypothetical protein